MDGLADARVRAATAEIAGHGRVEVLVRGHGMGREQRDRAHDLPGLAEAALGHVLRHPGSLDLYTNIAVAVFRLLALLPQAASAAKILDELVSGVGTFVKFLATYATEDVPGLAAMRPDGDFIRTLNTRQPGQPDPGVISYYAITSEFRPAIRGGTHEPRELPLRLVMALADGLVDEVMGEANDLLVNTASMTAIDEAVGVYVRDTFAFGATPHVYHTTYFTRPEVVSALTRWLALPAPVPATRDAGQAGTAGSRPRAAAADPRAARGLRAGVGRHQHRHRRCRRAGA
jgi:hypothetical protein